MLCRLFQSEELCTRSLFVSGMLDLSGSDSGIIWISFQRDFINP